MGKGDTYPVAAMRCRRNEARYYKFAEQLVKTVVRSLRFSCRSELTRFAIDVAIEEIRQSRRGGCFGSRRARKT
jgi:hypothetical protein